MSENTTLDPEEQKKLQELIAEAGGALFPDDMEVSDINMFQSFLKKAMRYSQQKAKEFLQVVFLGFSQKNISNQGKEEFLKKYQLAQAKRQAQTQQGIERTL